jgi:hypothetical protein
VQLQSFLMLALDGSEWSSSFPAMEPTTPPPHPHLAAIPGTHLIGGWVGHTACLDGFGEEKNLWPLLQIELQIIQPIV